MFKALGTLAFLFFVFCVIMLIASIFNRRINTKLWIICGVVSLLVLIVSYYVDISSGGYQAKYSDMIEQYNE
ncbi:MAG: hypothetical protein IKT39_02110 [Clostridia bacterium]|nr:hypothetical protein [Clostridia bacterium]